MISAHAEYDVLSRGYRIWIYRDSVAGMEVLGKDGEWKTAPELGLSVPASMALGKEMTQAVVQALIDAGIETRGYVKESLDAQGAHLKDMREIAQRLLGMVEKTL